MRKIVMLFCLSVLTLGICGCGSAQTSGVTEGKDPAMATFQRVNSDEAAYSSTKAPAKTVRAA